MLGIEDPTPNFGDGELVSIAIGPDPVALPLGAMVQLTATGMFDDGSSADITAQTEFSVETGSAITVTPQGLAHAVAEGSSTVTAKLGKIAGMTTARVVGASPDRLEFSFGDFQVAQLQRVRFHVIAVFTDDTRLDMTAAATYAIDNAAVAAIPSPGEIDSGSQAGMTPITASLGTARPGTIVATVTAKQCRPVINEFQTGSAVSGSDEWIEVLNPCTTTIDVDGWTLVYRGAMVTGGIDSNLMMTLTGQMGPGEIRLFAGQDFPGANDGKWAGATGLMQQNNGAIALRMGPRDTGPIGDSVAYGTVAATHPFIEGRPAAGMVNGRPAQRLPFDGRDGDDGELDLTQVMTGSPRALNAP